MKEDLSNVPWEIRPYRYMTVANNGLNPNAWGRRVQHIGKTVLAIFPSGRTVEVPGLGINEASEMRMRKAVEAHNKQLRIIAINRPGRK
jgi:hypothetical protein